MTRVLCLLAFALALAFGAAMHARHEAAAKARLRAEGQRAEQLGTTPRDNPYTQDAQRREWFGGWLDAREKRMKDAGLCEP